MSYRTTLKGQNCEDGKIVTKEEECKVASKMLGRKYVGRTTNIHRPAGCYWVVRAISNRDHLYSYFNTLVDVSSTIPTDGRGHGGICKEFRNDSFAGLFQFT